MNTIIKLYKVGSYANLFAVCVFTGLFLYDMITIACENSMEDTLGYFGFLAVAAIYCYSFYLDTLLFSNTTWVFKKINSWLRFIFILELLLALPYTVLVLFSFMSFNFSFDFKSWSGIERLVLVLCLYGAYAGSVIRLVFSKKLCRHFMEKEEDLLMEFGSG
jgi:hypothetical protein